MNGPSLNAADILLRRPVLSNNDKLIFAVKSLAPEKLGEMLNDIIESEIQSIRTKPININVLGPFLAKIDDLQSAGELEQAVIAINDFDV